MGQYLYNKRLQQTDDRASFFWHVSADPESSCYQSREIPGEMVWNKYHGNLLSSYAAARAFPGEVQFIFYRLLFCRIKYPQNSSRTFNLYRDYNDTEKNSRSQKTGRINITFSPE